MCGAERSLKDGATKQPAALHAPRSYFHRDRDRSRARIPLPYVPSQRRAVTLSLRCSHVLAATDCFPLTSSTFGTLASAGPQTDHEWLWARREHDWSPTTTRPLARTRTPGPDAVRASGVYAILAQEVPAHGRTIHADNIRSPAPGFAAPTLGFGGEKVRWTHALLVALEDGSTSAHPSRLAPHGDRTPPSESSGGSTVCAGMRRRQLFCARRLTSPFADT